MTLKERITYATKRRDDALSNGTINDIVYWNGYLDALNNLYVTLTPAEGKPLSITTSTTCPACEKTTEQIHEITIGKTFEDLISFVSDELSICPCCGSNRAGISKITFHEADDSFEIPLYKGPLT